MAVEPTGDLLTVKEAAALLKVSAVTINRYVKSGRLHAYQVGPRAIRIRREDMMNLLAPREEATMNRGTERRHLVAKPSKAELARRQAIGKKIMAKRDGRRIAPMTAADLVQRGRDESTWYDPRD